MQPDIFQQVTPASAVASRYDASEAIFIDYKKTSTRFYSTLVLTL